MNEVLFLLFLTLVTADLQDGKLCRHREDVFPQELWNKKAGGDCYFYSFDIWFQEPLPLKYCTEVKNKTDYRYICSVVNGTVVFFDYTDPHFSKIIENSFISTSYYEKWRNCAYNAEYCCLHEQDDQNIYPSEEFPCPATWDAWSCFPQATANSNSNLPCPDYTYSSESSPCILYSVKECFSNGTWNIQTNYSTCATAPVYRRRHEYHVITSYVSIALSFPAVIIFTVYTKLSSLRVNLHRNLLIACILRNVLNILQKELVILDSLRPSNETNNVLEDNGVGCKILAFFSSVSINAIYSCMLVDGFYLHKLIVRVFSPDPNAYVLYGISLVLAILPTLIWMIVLVSAGANELCWMVDTAWYQWIPDGFRIAILAANIILLCDIARALCTKLKKNITTPHAKSTVKAMVFLIPLFGVPFIFTASRDIIDRDSCTSGDIFYYTTYTIQALQGVMVAVLFCYCNHEVHMQFKDTKRKYFARYENRFGLQNFRRNTNNRCDTTATYVSPKIERKELQEELKNNNEGKGTERMDSNNIIQPNAPEVERQQSLSDGISKFIDDSG